MTKNEILYFYVGQYPSYVSGSCYDTNPNNSFNGNWAGSCVSGGGGSSFISGYSGCNAISESSTSSNIIHTGQPNHYSGKVFNNAQMIARNASMPNHDGNGNMTGNSGNGYAKIT